MRTESIQLVEWFMAALCPGATRRPLRSETGEARSIAALEASHDAPQSLGDLLGDEGNFVASLVEQYRHAEREDLAEVLEAISRAAGWAAGVSPGFQTPARLTGLVYPVL